MQVEVPDPWRSFLLDLDRRLPAPLQIHCIGGFAVSLYFGLKRATVDIDVIDVAPTDATRQLLALAGQGSELHSRHRVYLQMVAVATMPYEYEERLRAVRVEGLTNLSIFVPNPHDLVLSKLPRNLDLDFEDVLSLAGVQTLDLAILEQRYMQELRPYLHGSLERHDGTLRFWLDAIRESRQRDEQR